MSRYPKFLRNINWKYSIGEVILIVIGILTVLGLSNWNDSRKAYIEETYVLQELQVSLRNDLADINRNLVSNNAISSQLATTHSYNYELIKTIDKIDMDHVKDKVMPYYGEHFKEFKLFQTAPPIDYDFLLIDPYYKGLLEWLNSNREITIPQYIATKAKIEELLGLIEEELEER